MNISPRVKAAAKSTRKRLNTVRRGPVTLYLDKALFSAFRVECDALGISASRVLEELMREFFGGVSK